MYSLNANQRTPDISSECVCIQSPWTFQLRDLTPMRQMLSDQVYDQLGANGFTACPTATGSIENAPGVGQGSAHRAGGARSRTWKSGGISGSRRGCTIVTSAAPPSSVRNSNPGVSIARSMGHTGGGCAQVRAGMRAQLRIVLASRPDCRQRPARRHPKDRIVNESGLLFDRLRSFGERQVFFVFG